MLQIVLNKLMFGFRSLILRSVGIGLVVFGARLRARRLIQAVMRMLHSSRSLLPM